jgi:hypothetical protein
MCKTRRGFEPTIFRSKCIDAGDNTTPPGANPTIASYSASVVKFTALLIAWRVVRLKIIFLRFKNSLAYYNAGVVAVNFKIVGLAPGTDVMILKIFSPKNSAKKMAFLTQNKGKLCKILIITLVFEKKSQFFRRKLSKIAENCDHNIDPRTNHFWNVSLSDHRVPKPRTHPAGGVHGNRAAADATLHPATPAPGTHAAK